MTRDARSLFYTVYTTLSWRTFMCLRCVHGYKCALRVLSASSLDILIDLEVQGGICAMYWKRTWKTDRMMYYHHFNTGRDWAWYSRGILRRKLSRAMLEYGWSAFTWKRGK